MSNILGIYLRQVQTCSHVRLCMFRRDIISIFRRAVKTCMNLINARLYFSSNDVDNISPKHVAFYIWTLLNLTKINTYSNYCHKDWAGKTLSLNNRYNRRYYKNNFCLTNNSSLVSNDNRKVFPPTSSFQSPALQLLAYDGCLSASLIIYDVPIYEYMGP